MGSHTIKAQLRYYHHRYRAQGATPTVLSLRGENEPLVIRWLLLSEALRFSDLRVTCCRLYFSKVRLVFIHLFLN